MFSCPFKEKGQILDPRHWTHNKHNQATPPEISVLGLNGVAWRNNTGALASGTRFMRFGIPGQPDIMGIFKGGRPFGLEVKTKTGHLTPSQQWYHLLFRDMGMQIAVVRSYDDTIQTLKEWGIV